LKILQTLNPNLRRTLVILGGSGLMFWSSLASLLPGLPLYIQSLGGTDQQIGLTMGTFAIGLLIFRPPLGQLTDHYSRKLVVLIGLAAVAIAPMGYLYFPTIPMVMATRIFHGISIAAFTTAYTALVVDIAPEQQRGELIGYMSLVNPIGVAIGPALGGLLLEYLGYPGLFMVSTFLGTIGFICTWFVEEPPRPILQGHTPQTQTLQFHKVLTNPALSLPTWVLLLVGTAFGSLISFLPLYMQAVQVNLNSGFFYAAAALSSILIRILVGRASDRFGRGVFITLSLVLYTASMFLLSGVPAPNPQPWWFLLAGAFEGAGSGILIPTAIALVADRSDPIHRGQIFGICIGGFDLGIALGGPLLGLVSQYFGYSILFASNGIFTITAIILFLTMSNITLQDSFRFATGRTQDFYHHKMQK